MHVCCKPHTARGRCACRARDMFPVAQGLRAVTHGGTHKVDGTTRPGDVIALLLQGCITAGDLRAVAALLRSLPGLEQWLHATPALITARLRALLHTWPRDTAADVSDARSALAPPEHMREGPWAAAEEDVLAACEAVRSGRAHQRFNGLRVWSAADVDRPARPRWCHVSHGLQVLVLLPGTDALAVELQAGMRAGIGLVMQSQDPSLVIRAVAMAQTTGTDVPSKLQRHIITLCHTEGRLRECAASLTDQDAATAACRTGKQAHALCSPWAGETSPASVLTPRRAMRVATRLFIGP